MNDFFEVAREIRSAHKEGVRIEKQTQAELALANEGIPEFMFTDEDAERWTREYPSLLQSAQALIGYRPFNPPTDTF